MSKVFISIIIVLNTREDVLKTVDSSKKIAILSKKTNFNFEVILINNTKTNNVENQIDQLPSSIRKNIFLFNLTNKLQFENALLAGLDSANGDYVVVWEVNLFNDFELINEMVKKLEENSDIVYIRGSGRKENFFRKKATNFFYLTLKKETGIHIDQNAFHTRIISRRAINTILKIRTNIRYLKALYSLTGYNSSYIQVSNLVPKETANNFSTDLFNGLSTIISFSSFFQKSILKIFLLSFLFTIILIANAFTVKIFNIDLFGQFQEAVPGWGYLVIMTSSLFNILFLVLFIMFTYVANINKETTKRPLYIVESIKRF